MNFAYGAAHGADVFPVPGADVDKSGDTQSRTSAVFLTRNGRLRKASNGSLNNRDLRVIAFRVTA